MGFRGKNTGKLSDLSIGFNIVETQKVHLMKRAREGTDYTVDYNIGQLTIGMMRLLYPVLI
jgi:hypothetical protein